METNNKDLFIGPDITAEALINIQFKQECPKGNATKATSLILQTFSFFLALKRSGTKELVVGSSSEGRKVLIAAYSDLAAANPLHPEAKGYVSSFRHPDELAFTLNLSKTSQSALSSNFLTNIERNPENYGDFKYDKSTSTLRILPDLSNFKDALNKLQKTVQQLLNLHNTNQITSNTLQTTAKMVLPFSLKCIIKTVGKLLLMVKKLQF